MSPTPPPLGQLVYVSLWYLVSYKRGSVIHRCPLSLESKTRGLAAIFKLFRHLILPFWLFCHIKKNYQGYLQRFSLLFGALVVNFVGTVQFSDNWNRNQYISTCTAQSKCQSCVFGPIICEHNTVNNWYCIGSWMRMIQCTKRYWNMSIRKRTKVSSSNLK